MLSDRVKPVWADAQGDRGESSIEKWEPLSIEGFLVGFVPTNGSVVETLLRLRGGYVAFSVIRN